MIIAKLMKILGQLSLKLSKGAHEFILVLVKTSLQVYFCIFLLNHEIYILL